MASPTNVRITAPSTGKVRAGRPTPPAYINLLDQIAAAAPNSFLKLNLNRYESVWEHPAFRASYEKGSTDPAVYLVTPGSSPHVIINAWCSYAWDDDRMRLILWGGGHANGSNNEVYTWSGDTGMWSLAFHAHSVVTFQRANPGGGIRHRSIGGSLSAPVSSHTYNNNVWLPKLQKFLTFGGAAYDTGGSMMVVDANNMEIRQAGPFTLDMTLAGQGYTAVATGQNPQRPGTISEGVVLPGANAWSNRDYRLDHPQTALAAIATGGRATVVTEEEGCDVVYVQGGPSGTTSKDLIRIKMVDNDYHNDVISHVGATWSNGVSDAAPCFDPTRKLFFNPSFYSPSATDFIGGWDVRPGVAGTQNRYWSCPPGNVIGPDAAEFIAGAGAAIYGSLYDKRRDRFVVLSRRGAIYSLRAPAGTNYTTGWHVTKVVGQSAFADVGIEKPDTGTETGTSLCGRWKRSDKLDTYVFLTHTYDGNVWMFKPHDWLDPRNA